MAKQTEVLIIGGGASGLVAAIAAAVAGASVTLLEATGSFGKKILQSGNGRCNLSNENVVAGQYVGPGAAYAQDVLAAYTPEETRDFFRSIGVLTAADANGWVYPMSGRAQTVLTHLLQKAESPSVRMKTNAQVLEVLCKENAFSVKTADWTYTADALICACGSPASLKKGSYDFSFLNGLGHRMISTYPLLVPLYAKERPLPWAGVRRDVRLSLIDDQQTELFKTNGQLQLLREGISGIPVFDMSLYAVPLLDKGEELSVQIDFLPSLSLSEVTKILDEQFSLFPEKSATDILCALFPEALAGALAAKAEEKNAGALAKLCKAYILPLQSHAGMQKAQLSGGGIDTSELVAPHGASKKFPGLYFCGEALAVSGVCGGWNLQFAWSSGMLAGKAAANAGEKA